MKSQFLWAIFLLGMLVSACKKEETATPVDTEGIQQEFISLIEDVTTAEAYRYSTSDNAGNGMDCLKVVEHQEDVFVGVSHTYRPDKEVFVVNLATSTDLINWTFEKELSPAGSQPSIYKTADNAYVVAWEIYKKGITVGQLEVAYFNSFEDLKANAPSQKKSLALSQSICAEGTPNIYYADQQRIEMGFHYWSNCDIDRQGFGTLTNFRDWTTKKETQIDKAMLEYKVKGNIGDRDQFVYKGVPLLMIEAQDVKNDFSTWNSYIYNPTTRKALPIKIKTHTGTTSAANGTVTMLEFKGKNIVLLTKFLFRDSQGGCLIYYKELPG